MVGLWVMQRVAQREGEDAPRKGLGGGEKAQDKGAFWEINFFFVLS